MPIIETTTGPVRGSRDATGLNCFLGIPYAEPPVGPLRFKPTRPIDPWRDLLDASRFGPASAQVFDPLEATIEEFGESGDTPRFLGSEDSLTLNIWTPGLDAKRRPVIIWIHGGANWLESSRLPLYHGDRLASRGDVVVASLNYRLGIFGFLDLSVLDEPGYQGSAANGLRDQLTAIAWIKANAARFGGDPDNITLMGESAGSMNISWLIATGRLIGLVQRLVMMSGVASVVGLGHDGEVSVHSAAEGRRQASEFLDRLGIESMSQLGQMTTAEILDRQADLTARSDILFELDTLFYPRVDGEFIKATPFQAVRNGMAEDFDLLIGHTGYEMGLWLIWDDTLDRSTTADMATRLPAFPPQLRRSVAELYDRAFLGEPPGVRAMHLLGDACFVMPSVLLADEQARHSQKVWMYRFDRPGADPRKGALHAADIAFFLGTLDTRQAWDLIGPPGDAQEAASRASLGESIRSALVAFARAGDPNATDLPGLPLWPAYGATRQTMSLQTTGGRILVDPAGDRRRWWTERVYEPSLKT